MSTGKLLCAAAIVLCSPYTPMIFMGEEWAASTPWQFFASFPDPQLAEAVRTGRRREFARHGWGESDVPDPMSPQTVRNSRLKWDELAEGDHVKVLETYKALIALRRSRPELADPRLDRFVVEQDGLCFVLHRGETRVVVNLGTTPVPLPQGEVLLTSSANPSSLSPESFAVVAST